MENDEISDASASLLDRNDSLRPEGHHGASTWPLESTQRNTCES